MKTWSVLARDLHEGASIVVLQKAWDSNNKEFIIFPSYSGQDPDAIRPDVWMTWRHELKPPEIARRGSTAALLSPSSLNG